MLPIVAVVLLAWTAIDLADPQCCFRERLGAHSLSISATTDSNAANGDVDDCFCCAVCVDTGYRIPSMIQVLAVHRFPELPGDVLTRPASHYHPPQNE